jgi:hypothetical protein
MQQTCTKLHMSLLDLNALLRYTEFTPTEKYNIYQTGSRVYGTNKPDADYDFFMVITNEHFEQLDQKFKTNSVDHPFKEQWTRYLGDEEEHIDLPGYRCLFMDVDDISININLYSEEVFRRKIDENWLQALMAVFLPDHHIWRLDITDGIAADQVPIYLRKLILTVIGESGRHWDLAQRGWNSTADHVVLKKYLVHCFRDVMFGIQITEHSSIVDYHAANEIYKEMMQYDSTEWKFYSSKFYPRLQTLKDQFNKLTNDIMLIGALPSLEKRKIGQSCLQDFYNQKTKSLNALQYLLSIQVTEHPHYPNVFHLCDTELSPHTSSAVLEVGNGMLVQIEDGNMTVIACSIPKVLPYTDHCVPKLDYSSGIPISNKKSKSILLTMYWYNDCWNVFSENTPNVSETTISGISLVDLFFSMVKRPNIEDNGFCYTFLLDTSDVIAMTSNIDDLLVDQYVCDNSNVVLVAVTDTSALRQVSISSFAQKYEWNVNDAQIHVKSDLDVLTYVCHLDPLLYKEAWVCDANFRQLSVPVPQRESLLALLRTYGVTNPESEKNMVDVVRSVFYDQLNLDRLQNFIHDHYVDLFELFQTTCNKFQRFCNYFDQIYLKLSTCVDQKKFVEMEASLSLNEFASTDKIRNMIKMIFLQMRTGKKNIPSGIEISSFALFFALCGNDKIYPLFKEFL